MKFRKKPVVVEAMKWTGFNYTESEQFCGEELAKGKYEDATGPGCWPPPYETAVKLISTLEGTMKCQPGDWIVKGVKGECYPVKPDIFEETYEAVK